MKSKILLLLSLIPLFIIGCRKEGSLAGVKTYVPKYVASNSATIGCIITSDGGTGIADCGVYMSFSENPETSGVKLQMGNDTGIFMGRVTGLTPATQYFIKAYAVNDKGQALGEQVAITTTATVKDFDNIVYETVKIGDQFWMASNLKTTHYMNGDAISSTTPATLDISGEVSPKYQWTYGGDDLNLPAYGKLYTWHAVTDSRNLCPTGWRVPTDSDWSTLELTLGGFQTAAGRLKEMGNGHWQSPYNTDATNESCFTALPGGYRDMTGPFYVLRNDGYWWSVTESEATKSYARIMSTVSESVMRLGISKNWGLSVRCIKN